MSDSSIAESEDQQSSQLVDSSADNMASGAEELEDPDTLSLDGAGAHGTLATINTKVSKSKLPEGFSPMPLQLSKPTGAANEDDRKLVAMLMK